MRALIQRVQKGSVWVDGNPITRDIQTGLMIFLGIGMDDDENKADYLARKIAFLRIFPDADEKMNLSIQEVNGQAIVVSQFTLYADTRKGHRPSFTDAAAPAIAEHLVDYFSRQLSSYGINTQQGQFAAHMMVSLINDGPVTIWMEY